MSKHSLQCSSCEPSSLLTLKMTKWGKSYNINSCTVYSVTETGGGYEGLVAFCAVMYIPCLTKSAYYKQIKWCFRRWGIGRVEKCWRLQQHILTPEKGKDGTLDPAASLYCTWARRGFTSLTGAVFIIALDTGEVLGYQILSRSCQKCALEKSKCDSDEEFEELLDHEFDMNFPCSSPAMEIEEAAVLWASLTEHHNFVAQVEQQQCCGKWIYSSELPMWPALHTSKTFCTCKSECWNSNPIVWFYQFFSWFDSSFTYQHHH